MDFQGTLHAKISEYGRKQLQTTMRKSEIIIGNMEPEEYSNNTKTTACGVRRLYNAEQPLIHVFNTMETLETS